MVRKAAGQFFIWLFSGIAAGILLAFIFSFQQYRISAEIAGSILQSESLAQGLKQHSVVFYPEGAEFLHNYGYRMSGSFWRYLPFTMGISIVFFQIVGWISFWIQWQKEKRFRQRILELTEYLKAVNSGEAAVLCRKEDAFSHLEDEMYKTVIRLRTTREEAVQNHEILSERIADIAHQLKTPLTSMSLMTELLEEYQTSETREYLIRLSSQIERLRALVSGLLSLAKLDSHEIIFQMEKTELSELLRSAAEPLQESLLREQITLSIKESGRECFIYADRQWTEEALTNLLKNCMEHTPAGGQILVMYHQNSLYTELQIQDTGSGFSKEDLPYVFQRFYRGKGAAKDNAGIGLALAKAVLEQQNGQIAAENTADGHARFRLKWYHF